MWIFDRLGLSRKYTIARLAKELRMNPNFEVMSADNEDSIAIKADGEIAAYVLLENDGREAVVFYEYNCRPDIAAYIALSLSDVIDTYAPPAELFVATKLEDTTGVH